MVRVNHLGFQFDFSALRPVLDVFWGVLQICIIFQRYLKPYDIDRYRAEIAANSHTRFKTAPWAQKGATYFDWARILISYFLMFKSCFKINTET